MAGGEPAWEASSCFSASTFAAIRSWAERRSRCSRSTARRASSAARTSWRRGGDGLFPSGDDLLGLGDSGAAFLDGLLGGDDPLAAGGDGGLALGDEGLALRDDRLALGDGSLGGGEDRSGLGDLGLLGDAALLGLVAAEGEAVLLRAEGLDAEEEVAVLGLEGDELVALADEGALEAAEVVAAGVALVLLVGDAVGDGADGLFLLAVLGLGGGADLGGRRNLGLEGGELLLLDADLLGGPGELDPGVLAEEGEFLDAGGVRVLALDGPFPGHAGLVQRLADLDGLSLDPLEFLAEAA